MTENIFWTFENEVIGEIEALNSLMKEMVDFTKLNNPGTIYYEWFVSDDNKKCTLFERYDNSDSALAQADIFGKNFAMRFMEILKPKKFTLYGSPSDGLKKAGEKMGAAFMIPIGGFSK